MATEIKPTHKPAPQLVSFPQSARKKWLKQRRQGGQDRNDVVWDRVDVVAAKANNEYQQIGRRLANDLEADLADWFGGPDLAVEIVSRNDRLRQKFDSDAKLRAHELLHATQGKNGSLELFQRVGEAWNLDGKVRPESHNPLITSMLPVTFRLPDTKPRPQIEVLLNGAARHGLVGISRHE